METDEPEAGAPAAPAESNVVRFPRDWLGPLDELVPFGPAARAPEPSPEPVDASPAEGQVVDFPALGPVRPEDFWGEGSAAIHHALEAPAAVEAGTRRTASSARLGQIGVGAMAAVARMIVAMAGALVARIQRGASRVVLMLRLSAASACAMTRRAFVAAVAAGGRVCGAAMPKRIAATPAVALTAGAVVASLVGFVINGLGGTSLERSSPNVRAAGAFASGPAAISAITQLERHVPPPALAAAPEHSHPPPHRQAPATGGVAPTYMGAPNQAAVSTPAASSAAAVTHVATSAAPVTTTSADRGSAGGGGTRRQVAAPDAASAGGSSGSTSQPPAGPVGPGAPFGPGHLG